jgi:hypothetical protein
MYEAGQVVARALTAVRRAADVEQIIDRPVPSCRQIAVTSIPAATPAANAAITIRYSSARPFRISRTTPPNFRAALHAESCVMNTRAACNSLLQ